MSKNSKKEIQATIEELEMVVLGDEFNNIRFDDYFQTAMLDVIVGEVAKISRRDLTFSEMLEEIDDDLVDTEFDNDFDYQERRVVEVLSLIYKHWADFEAIESREDNVLRMADSPDDWKIGYQKSLANLIAVHGVPVSLTPSHYGWADYDLMSSEFNRTLRYKHIAVFNVKEDYWREFNGTFNTDDDSHSGMVADVVYSTGISRKVRYEGTLREIMDKI